MFVWELYKHKYSWKFYIKMYGGSHIQTQLIRAFFFFFPGSLILKSNWSITQFSALVLQDSSNFLTGQVGLWATATASLLSRKPFLTIWMMETSHSDLKGYICKCFLSLSLKYEGYGLVTYILKELKIGIKMRTLWFRGIPPPDFRHIFLFWSYLQLTMTEENRKEPYHESALMITEWGRVHITQLLKIKNKHLSFIMKY